jgi:hypothetical protein
MCKLLFNSRLLDPNFIKNFYNKNLIWNWVPKNSIVEKTIQKHHLGGVGEGKTFSVNTRAWLQVNEPKLWDVWSLKIWNKKHLQSLIKLHFPKPKKTCKALWNFTSWNKKNLQSLMKLHFTKHAKDLGKRSSIIYREWIFNNLWKLPTKVCLETPTS